VHHGRNCSWKSRVHLSRHLYIGVGIRAYHGLTRHVLSRPYTALGPVYIVLSTFIATLMVTTACPDFLRRTKERRTTALKPLRVRTWDNCETSNEAAHGAR